MLNCKKCGITALLIASITSADVGKLTNVVDSDTIYFGEVKCRLAFLDTPESKNNSKAKKDVSRCIGMTVPQMVEAGEKSAEYTKTQLQIGRSYKYEVTDTDHYGRSVCLVEANGGSLNLKIVAAGYAIPYERYIPDEQTKRLFIKEMHNAKQSNRGLWSTYRPVLECMDK